jgi:hypothetical protein
MISKIISRYSSVHADVFKFILAFNGKISDPDLYEAMMMYLKARDPHYRLRSLTDDFDNESAWYETVNVIVGL